MEYNEYKCDGIEKIAYEVAKIRTLNNVIDVFRNQDGELYWKSRDKDEDNSSIDECRMNPEFIHTFTYIGSIQTDNKRAMNKVIETIKFELYQAESYKETEYYQKKYINK